MIPGRILIDDTREAATALGRGQTLWESLTTAGGRAGPVCSFYAAPLCGSVLSLGAYQQPAQALAEPEQAPRRAVRRCTGGVTVAAGEGALYVALGLRDASSLMSCPPGRTLNRNVRGLLEGLRSLAVPAHYFGRDFVSVAGQPAAYIAWHQALAQSVLLEVFVGLSRSFMPDRAALGYPQPNEPPFRGKAPISLRDAGVAAPASEVLARVAEGYAKVHAVEFVEGALSVSEMARSEALAAAAAAQTDPAAGAELAWSDPVEEAIGFVSGGVALNAQGGIARAELAGDFMQHAGCARDLQAALEGRRPSAHTIGAALDRTYAASPGRIEGVRSLKSLRDALLQAASRAGGSM